MEDFRRTMMPYGMSKNESGSWTFFNRNYKPVGVVSSEWAEWEDPRHVLRFKRIDRRTLKNLDIDGLGAGERIFFYNDATVPTSSTKAMRAYLDKLAILMGLSS